MWSFLPFSRTWKQAMGLGLDASTHASRLPDALRDTWRLRDGTPVTLRPARECDGALMQEFVRGLSMESRYHRFFYPAHELTPTMLDRFTHNAPTVATTLLAVIHRQGGDVVIAMGQYVADPYPDRCDFAAVVADPWQRHGLGTRLIRSLVCMARAAGIERIEGDILAENGAMLRLMQGLGFNLARHPDGAYLVRATKALDVPAWKCSTMARASAGTAIG